MGLRPWESGVVLAESMGDCFKARTVAVEWSVADRPLAFGFREIAVLFQLFEIGFRFSLQG